MILTSLIYTQKSLGDHCYLIVLGNRIAQIKKIYMKVHIIHLKRI